MRSSGSSPRVSAFMAVFDGMPYVEEAVQSVLAQTFTDFELLIVNDGSTDGTAEFLESLDDPRVRIVHKANEGLGQPLNRWLRECRGEYIMRVDADDVCLPTRMELQAKFLDGHENTVIVGTQFVPFTDAGAGRPTHLPLTNEAIVAGMLRGWHTMSHATTMWRRSILEEIEGYAYSGPGEDWSLLLDSTRVGELANLPKVLYRVRLDPASSAWRGSEGVLTGFAYARARHRRFGHDGSDLSIEEFATTWSSRNVFSKFFAGIQARSLVMHRMAVVDQVAGKRATGYLKLLVAAVLDPKKSVGSIWKRL